MNEWQWLAGQVFVRVALVALIVYAAYFSYCTAWWKTPRQCAYAAVIYGVLPMAGVALAWLDVVGSAIVVMCGLGGIISTWFCAYVFRVEADHILRPVLSDKEIDDLLASKPYVGPPGDNFSGRP